MSKSEKRYFTLDAKKSSSKGSKYLVLFQAVNDMEIYDEAKLKKKFGKNLRYDKSYLYEAIMRSMRDYRSANSYAAKIKEMILDAQYLYERSLYQQCGERLEEAKGLATELDDQLSLLEINNSQRLLLRQLKGKEYKGLMEGLIRNKEGILNRIKDEFKFFDLSDELILLVNRNFQLNNESEIENFKDQFPISLFESDATTLSGRSKLRYLQSSALYYQLLRASDKVLHFYTEVVNWWDENPKIKEEEFHKYIIDVSNLLHAISSKGYYHQLPTIISRLENEKPRSNHDQGMVFQKTSIYKLFYYINSGVSDGIENVVETVSSGLDKYQIKSGSRNALIFNTSVMLFMQEKFRQCVDWNTKIIKGDKYINRRDIKSGVMILHLVALFELSELEIFEGFLRKMGRFLTVQKKSGHGAFERKVLNYFRELYHSPEGEWRFHYQNLKSFIVENDKTGEYKVPLGLDELLLLWVNSKLEKKKILQQLREKNAISA